jgi:metallophosphoesterase superfamily enzyme
VHNSEWNLFCEFVAYRSGIEFILVIGNHDIMERRHYESLCLKIVEKEFILDDLILTHEPMNDIPEGKINVAGHIHPGYILQGKGRQSIKLPCFYFRRDQLVLPAFGSLTGLYALEKEKNTEIFVIANDKVIEI